MVDNKTQLFNKCLKIINDRIEQYQAEMDNIKESMEANDVHTDYDEEGSKGELLGDFEKYAKYLDNAQKNKAILRKVNVDHYSESIRFGSTVETDNNYYFIAGPVGEVKLDDGSSVFVISTEAPIYEKMEGKKIGDEFEINGNTVKILDVH